MVVEARRTDAPTTTLGSVPAARSLMTSIPYMTYLVS